ncbi:MAG: trigger factor [Gammaproteobacteria bacterium]|nr:trigger factor [Gammaproteobacteria bacterium]MBU2056757.1 trigger factor [Gammaproteobacteria bacterium]MBU2174094.1 trigger factor [Gammaproteobacteria bacterium]MBU2247000.1 trigger factor [Gammaproteobacteria bacterium]MBU2343385.1 trigger factor [Gammaproteobacteria bacterium]
MQVSVETTQGLERRLTITVPAAAISTEVDKELKKIAKNRRVDGFRPGKAPVAMIKKMFGLSVLQDVASRQMQNHFYQAIIANKLTPAGAPTFAPGQLAEGKDLEFAATFEVYPEVQLNALDKIEVTKPVVEITADDLETMLGTLRKQHATWATTEAAAASGDRVIIDFVGSIDGEEFEGGKASDFTLELGQGRMIPGFEDGIIGKKAGEEVTVDVTFPAEYHAENLKGKAASFAVTVKAVEAQQLPEVNDEFAKLFGLAEATVDALKVEVKKNMERELNNSIKGRVKEQVIKGLLATHEIEVPQALIDSEIDVLRRQALQRFGNNLDPKQLPELPAALFTEQAKDRVKVGLLLGEVIKTNSLQVEDARVQSLIETVASAYEDPQEVIQYYNSNKELLQGMRNVALEEQAIDLVLTKAKVTEEKARFDEIMNPQAAN